MHDDSATAMRLMYDVVVAGTMARSSTGFMLSCSDCIEALRELCKSSKVSISAHAHHTPDLERLGSVRASAHSEQKKPRGRASPVSFPRQLFPFARFRR